MFGAPNAELDKALILRGKPPQQEGEWVAVMCIWVDTHVRGPEFGSTNILFGITASMSLCAMAIQKTPVIGAALSISREATNERHDQGS